MKPDNTLTTLTITAVLLLSVLACVTPIFPTPTPAPTSTLQAATVTPSAALVIYPTITPSPTLLMTEGGRLATNPAPKVTP